MNFVRENQDTIGNLTIIDFDSNRQLFTFYFTVSSDSGGANLN